MKQNRNLLNSLLGGAIALALVSTAVAQGMDSAAKVIRVKGPARYTTGNNVWQPVKPGDILRAGTVIQTSTEEGSYVDLVLGDGKASVPQAVSYNISVPNSMAASSTSFRPSSEQNVVRIWANSAMGIDKLTMMQTGAETVSETQLDLKQGRITGNVKKMSAASKYEVKLPNGVAGIRGSSGSLSSDGSAQWLHGEIILSFIGSNGQPHVVVVHGGFEYNPQTGQILHLSPQAIAALERFGAYASTLYAQVYPVAQNITFVYISPTQGVPTSVTPPVSAGIMGNHGVSIPIH